METEFCKCGHEKGCHVDLMESINKSVKKEKVIIAWIPCLINDCNCQKFLEKKIINS